MSGVVVVSMTKEDLKELLVEAGTEAYIKAYKDISNLMSNQYLSQTEAAKMIGCTRQTFAKRAIELGIEKYPIGRGKYKRIEVITKMEQLQVPLNQYP